MTVVIDLPESTGAAFAAEARERGVALEQILRDCLVEASGRSAAARRRAEEMEEVLDEIAEIVGHQERPQIPAEALRRENLYGDDER